MLQKGLKYNNMTYIHYTNMTNIHSATSEISKKISGQK